MKCPNCETYIYCLECGKPVRCQSTFYESVIKGKQHKKTLVASCGKSGNLCKNCYLKSKKDNICDYPSCIKMKGGVCLEVS